MEARLPAFANTLPSPAYLLVLHTHPPSFRVRNSRYRVSVLPFKSKASNGANSYQLPFWRSFQNSPLYKCKRMLDFSRILFQYAEIARNGVFVRLVATVVLASAAASSVSTSHPALALNEENLLFLEAWRTIDRAYVDKSFNGQSWFRYRESALRNEPMNTREETYSAIKKMLATLDDPYTRFLEPEKFRSLRSGTQGALTGVGLSIASPSNSSSGLPVISSSPGGPASKAGISSGDIILSIDGVSTENMSIYDAADRLQGEEGSSVAITFLRGPQANQVTLKREKVSLNPVKSRVCELQSSMGKNPSRIGYIKLTSFNQNASGAVREAIETLRSSGVDSFVLDLRDNSGGLFPEGIEIAKLWLEKGVIVYVCDSSGVRDIYDTDGGAIAASEPLAVLVNKGTASASEILAGALKDNNRAVLFGEATYGKGKIQSVFQLSDGSGLAVTVARYETPAHIDINKVGVVPDHPLPKSMPKDEDGVCGCLQDSSSLCHFNSFGIFST